MSNSRLNRDAVHERTVALPLVEYGETVDELTASAIMEELRQNGSALVEHILTQIDEITDEVNTEIGDVLPTVILRGIIARATRAGAAQAISDTGHSAQNVAKIKEILAVDIVQTDKTA